MKKYYVFFLATCASFLPVASSSNIEIINNTEEKPNLEPAIRADTPIQNPNREVNNDVDPLWVVYEEAADFYPNNNNNNNNNNNEPNKLIDDEKLTSKDNNKKNPLIGKALSFCKSKNINGLEGLIKGKDDIFLEGLDPQKLFEAACHDENIDAATFLVMNYPVKIKQNQSELLEEMFLAQKLHMADFLIEKMGAKVFPETIKKYIVLDDMPIVTLMIATHDIAPSVAHDLFFFSIIYNKKHVVAFFVQSTKLAVGVDDVKDKDHRCTGLMYACREGHLDLVHLFIEELGANVFLEDERQRNAYMIAAMKGHHLILEYLDQKFPKQRWNEKRDHKGRNASLLAAKNNHVNVLNYLYTQKGDTLSSIDYDGHTCIMLATILGHLNTVRFLMQRNPKLYHFSKAGFHIMDLVLLNKNINLSVKKYFMKHKNIDQVYEGPLYIFLLNKQSRRYLFSGYIRAYSQQRLPNDVYQKIFNFFYSPFYLENHAKLFPWVKLKEINLTRVPKQFPSTIPLFTMGCVTGHLDTVRWALTKKKHTPNQALLLAIVQYGHLHVLRFFLTINKKKCQPYMNYMLYTAFHNDQYHIMEFLSKRGAYLLVDDITTTRQEFEKLAHSKTYVGQVIHYNELHQKMTLACQKGKLRFIKWIMVYDVLSFQDVVSKFLLVKQQMNRINAKEKYTEQTLNNKQSHADDASKIEKESKKENLKKYYASLQDEKRKKKAQLFYYICQAVKFDCPHVIDYFSSLINIDINYPDTEGNTFFSTACRYRSHAFVEKLVTNGKPDFAYVDKELNNIFMLACMRKHNLNLLRYLHSLFPFELHGKNKKGRTPLLLACWRGSLDMVKFLIHLDKTTLEDRDKYGHNALMMSAISGSEDIAKFLITKGMNPQETNHLHQRAYALAKQGNYNNLANYLTQASRLYGKKQVKRIT